MGARYLCRTAPAEAREVVRRIEELVEAPVALLSHQPGARRHHHDARPVRGVGEMAGGDIDVHARRPDPRLAGLVNAICGYDERTPGPMRQELPGTAIVMILELGPPITVTDGAGTARHPLGFVCGIALAPC